MKKKHTCTTEYRCKFGSNQPFILCIEAELGDDCHTDVPYSCKPVDTTVCHAGTCECKMGTVVGDNNECTFGKS